MGLDLAARPSGLAAEAVDLSLYLRVAVPVTMSVTPQHVADSTVCAPEVLVRRSCIQHACKAEKVQGQKPPIGVDETAFAVEFEDQRLSDCEVAVKNP
jgi:hypothetical protein